MGFGQAVWSVFRQYVTFRGRACRAEFWWFQVFHLLVSLAINVLYLATGHHQPGFLLSLWELAILLPGLAVGVRRLHDVGRSGWWSFLILVPFGGIILIVWNVRRGTRGDNKYGSDPLLAVPA
jgi:uncharacterized membrane protein YhaH (DUF805 family)